MPRPTVTRTALWRAGRARLQPVMEIELPLTALIGEMIQAARNSQRQQSLALLMN